MRTVLPSQITKGLDVLATKTTAIMEEPLLHCASQTPCNWEAPAGWPQAPGWAWSVGLTCSPGARSPHAGRAALLSAACYGSTRTNRPLPGRGAPAWWGTRRVFGAEM